MPSRISFLFQFTTDPPAGYGARRHTAGWSESLWYPDADPPAGRLDFLAGDRARILPSAAAIIGQRIQVYTLEGNRLKPGGASTLKVNYPGNQLWTCDIPQMALEVALKASGAPNSSRILIRGIPDDQVLGGEYTGTATYKGQVTTYLNRMQNLNFQFLGRNLSNISVRVISIAANLLVTDVPCGAIPGDYVRLLRVYDINGRPISGSFRVQSGSGVNLTLLGLPAGLAVEQSGACRKDEFALRSIASHEIGRIRVKKVGRPFEGYRGRRSTMA